MGSTIFLIKFQKNEFLEPTINGIIFNIDEDAFEKLNNYLNVLRQHFKNLEGKEEILEDIEIRISELLTEKLEEQKQVISINDIHYIIDILGKPSDFIDSDEGADISGNTDLHKGKTSKRLYRDPDNQVLGGVCSGLGAYFKVNPLWFRLFFIILTLVGGSGLLIYFILWLAVPLASSTAEKLEMKGEKVTINNIEKSIRDELESIRDNINGMSGKKSGGKKKHSDKQNIPENLFNVFLSFLKIVIRILLIIIGISLLIAAILILASFFGLVFGWNGFFMMEGPEIVDISINSLFRMIYPVSESLGLYKMGFILFVAIPFLMIIYNAIRLIFRMERIKYLGLAAINLWIFGLILMFVFAFKTVKEFKYSTTTYKEIYADVPSGKNVYLNMEDFIGSNPMKEEIELFLTDDNSIFITEQGKYFDNVWFEIEDSDDGLLNINKHTFSRGKNPSSAEENAETANYPIETNDTVFTFNRFYFLDNESPWRTQRIKIEIQIPEGTNVIIDDELKEFMRYNRHDYEWDEWEDSPRNYWRSSFPGLETFPDFNYEIERSFLMNI